MVAIKAHQAASFLKSPDKKLAAVLFYGTDAGMVSERAGLLARQIASQDDPPGDVIRIGDNDLEQDPDRLIVELQTMPMFGGRQVVRAVNSRRLTPASIEPLLKEGNLAGYLIIEAGNLKPADALRKLFEKSAIAAAVACYPDAARDLDGMIREALGPELSIAPDAKTALIARLGADRALSRGEVKKLALYVTGRTTVELSDVEEIVGDASEQALDKIITAAASGDSAAAVRECDRMVSAGDSPQAVILAAGRYFQRLHRVRAALDEGRSLDDALRGLRPPVHFKQKDALGALVRAWSAARLATALSRIANTAKAARLNSALEATLAERLLLELAWLARAKGTAPARR